MMPKIQLGLEGRGRGRTFSPTRFWVLELVARATRVLMSMQVRMMAMVGMASGSNFRQSEAWAKTVAQRASRIHLQRHHRLSFCSPLVFLISVCFLVRSHHFDCFSITSAIRRLVSLPVPPPRTSCTSSLYSSLPSHLALELTCMSNY